MSLFETALEAAKTALETVQATLKTKEDALAAGGDANVLNPEIQALRARQELAESNYVGWPGVGFPIAAWCRSFTG